MLRFARNDGILEFPKIKIPPNPQKRKYKTNSRIPYRDPPKGLGDGIVGNSRIPKANLEFPKDEFRISRDCFASLAMTKILEFHIEITQKGWGMT